MSTRYPLNHLGSIWYHLEPSDVPYSPNQFLGWELFCRFLQQDGSRRLSMIRSGSKIILLVQFSCFRNIILLLNDLVVIYFFWWHYWHKSWIKQLAPSSLYQLFWPEKNIWPQNYSRIWAKFCSHYDPYRLFWPEEVDDRSILEEFEHSKLLWDEFWSKKLWSQTRSLNYIVLWIWILVSYE